MNLNGHDVWYHGGRKGTPIHAGIYVSQNPKYAEKYARQHLHGAIQKFHLRMPIKVHPKAFWWQDYNNMWQKEHAFKDYDAVRIIEPAMSWDEIDHKSLLILNPRVLVKIGEDEVSESVSGTRAMRIMQQIVEVAPPGFEGTVLTMKKRHAKEIDNPWALSWWMKNKGYHSHKTKLGKEKHE